MDSLHIPEIMCPQSLEHRVYRIVTELFTVPMESVMPQSTPRTVEGWDSFGHLNLVLALEEEFGIKFAPEQIEKMTDVGKIIAFVAQMNPQNSGH